MVRSIGARSCVKVGLPTWSDTKLSCGCSRASRITVLTMFEPLRPHTHDGAHNRRGSAHRQRFLFANQLAAAVLALRIGRVGLAVRAIQRSVEDVVGADLHEVRLRTCARLGKPSNGRRRWRPARERDLPRSCRRQSTPRS